MKPTQEQLNDPKWWDDNAPEGAEALIDDCFVKWVEGKEYTFTSLEWVTEVGSWTLQDYKNDSGFCVAERPAKPAFVPEVGVECEFNTGGDSEYKKCLIVGRHYKTGRPIVDHLRIGRDDINHAPECWKFRPIKSERELFVEAGVKANRNLGIGATQEEMFEALYDAGCRFLETDK